jgi:hypothetical protein
MNTAVRGGLSARVAWESTVAFAAALLLTTCSEGPAKLPVSWVTPVATFVSLPSRKGWPLAAKAVLVRPTTSASITAKPSTVAVLLPTHSIPFVSHITFLRAVFSISPRSLHSFRRDEKERRHPALQNK